MTRRINNSILIFNDSKITKILNNSLFYSNIEVDSKREVKRMTQQQNRLAVVMEEDSLRSAEDEPDFGKVTFR